METNNWYVYKKLHDGRWKYVGARWSEFHATVLANEYRSDGWEVKVEQVKK